MDIGTIVTRLLSKMYHLASCIRSAMKLLLSLTGRLTPGRITTSGRPCQIRAQLRPRSPLPSTACSFPGSTTGSAAHRLPRAPLHLLLPLLPPPLQLLVRRIRCKRSRSPANVNQFKPRPHSSPDHLRQLALLLSPVVRLLALRYIRESDTTILPPKHWTIWCSSATTVVKARVFLTSEYLLQSSI